MGEEVSLIGAVPQLRYISILEKKKKGDDFHISKGI